MDLDLKYQTFIDGEFWVSVIPSLDVTGYGKTEEEAIKDMEYNLEIYYEDLLESLVD